MRNILIAMTLGLLAACSPIADLDETVVPIGDFKLGHAVARVSGEVSKGPFSRDATAEEWTAAMTPELKRRFSRYDGDKFYHLGVSIDGYLIAQPGIPVVLSPKSLLVISVVVIDNETRQVLNEVPEQFRITETFSIVGSGVTQTKEEQMQDLSQIAARDVEKWMRQQPWFYPDGVVPSVEE